MEPIVIYDMWNDQSIVRYTEENSCIALKLVWQGDVEDGVMFFYPEQAKQLSDALLQAIDAYNENEKPRR